MRIRQLENAKEEAIILQDDDLFGFNESSLTDEELDGIKGGRQAVTTAAAAAWAGTGSSTITRQSERLEDDGAQLPT